MYGRTTQNQSDRLLTVELAVENGDRFAVNGPLLVGLENISNPNVALLNADGFLPDGTPFVSFESSIDGAVMPNEASRSVEVSFFNPTFNQFRYDLVFLGKLNRDPQFNSLPRLEAISGMDYRYRVSGSDFDDDQLHFGLLQSPDGMTIDESSGEILWNVEPKDLGNHQVVVSVSDGRGGSNRQTFNLSAVEPPPNRPPIFTTDPVLVAVSNEPYVYDANASDPDLDLISFALEDGPEGMSIDAETGLISWAVEGIGPSQHDVSITVSDGAGGVSTQAFVLAVKGSPNRLPVDKGGVLTSVWSATCGARKVHGCGNPAIGSGPIAARQTAPGTDVCHRNARLGGCQSAISGSEFQPTRYQCLARQGTDRPPGDATVKFRAGA